MTRATRPAGAGVSMAMPAAQNAVLSSVGKLEVGKASGVFNMFRFLGGVSGVARAVAVFVGRGDFQLRSDIYCWICGSDQRRSSLVVHRSRRRRVAARET
jgi:hypothetical protein